MSRPGSRRAVWAFALLAQCSAGSLTAQEPAAWGETPYFHTFSIAAVDTATGESGVAVTTRVPCVGNGVPWVRAGVGAVATQAWTRVDYGVELLDMLAEGLSPTAALERATAADSGSARRQVGVVAIDGSTAQHTGDGTDAWKGHRAGPNYAVQGNLLVGSAVIDAVAKDFEDSADSPRHLADRLIAALTAGQAAGGDARKGRLQSAAVLVADPRPGRSRRPDGVTVSLNVCEHPTPVAELRRLYDTISGTLGYRTLERFSGRDVLQLKVILHALGYFRSDEEALERNRELFVFDEEAIAAVDAFRDDHGLSTPQVGSPSGLVDAELVELLWRELHTAGLAEEVRRELLETTAIRR